MGQKVNPRVMRLGIVYDEESTWYANKFNYSDNLLEDKKIRDYIKKKYYRAGVAKILIRKRSKQVEVDIFTARPGVIIGKGGEEASNLKLDVERLLGKKVLINIIEEKKVDLNAQLLAESISSQIERRIAFKRAMRQAMTTALRANALGIRVRVSGRLNGSEIARAEWYMEGRVPLHTLRAHIDYGFTEALTTYGKIGIKVWVYRGDVIDRKEVENDANNARTNSKVGAQA